jgi:hypothetical protein
MLDSSDAEASAADVGVDALGNATAIWMQGGAGWASRFDSSSTSWTPPVQVAPSPRNGHVNVEVAANGNAIAIWGSVVSYFDGASKSWQPTGVSVSRGWGCCEDVDYMGNYAGDVGIDASGNALVATIFRTEPPASTHSGRFEIGLVRYDVATSTWGAWQSLAAPFAFDTRFQGVRVVMSDNGDAVVLWQWETMAGSGPYVAAETEGGIGTNVCSDSGYCNAARAGVSGSGRILAAGDLSSSPYLFDPLAAAWKMRLAPGRFGAFHVAANGTAIAVPILGREGLGSDFQAFVFDMNTETWSGPELISAAKDVYDPAVHVDRTGNATIVWVSDGAGISRVSASYRFAAAGSWSVAKVIGPDEPPAVSPRVAGDSSSGTFAVWSQGAPASVWANRCTLARFDCRKADSANPCPEPAE